MLEFEREMLLLIVTDKISSSLWIICIFCFSIIVVVVVNMNNKVDRTYPTNISLDLSH